MKYFRSTHRSLFDDQSSWTNLSTCVTLFRNSYGRTKEGESSRLRLSDRCRTNCRGILRSLREGRDDLGWVSHTRDTVITAEPNWLVGESKTCYSTPVDPTTAKAISVELGALR